MREYGFSLTSILPYSRIFYEVNGEENNKYNCTGPPAFKSQRDRVLLSA